MTDAKEVWQALAALDVNKHVEKKGGFSYLAWTWAWATVKERYPCANYEILPDMQYPSDTREVRCAVTIEGMTHVMWLPVTDHRNQAIVNPDAFQINTARMRCLVKCLAMFGLGFYIYAGESAPQEPQATEEEWQELLALMAANDVIGVHEFSNTHSGSVMEALFNRAEKGKKTKFKEDLRGMYREANLRIAAVTDALVQHLEREDGSIDASGIKEIEAECEPYEWNRAVGALPEQHRAAIAHFLTEEGR